MSAVNNAPKDGENWNKRGGVDVRGTYSDVYERSATWGEWFGHGIAAFGSALAFPIGIWFEDYRNFVSGQHKKAWSRTHYEPIEQTPEKIAAQQAKARTSKEDILEDLGNKKFSKLSVQGKEYWVKINPQDGSVLWMEEDENGNPDVDNAYYTKFFGMNNENIVDQDRIQKLLTDSYLKMHATLGKTFLAYQAVVMNLKEGGGYAFHKMPPSEIALDDIGQANISFDKLLPQDIKKSIKDSFFDDQGKPIPKKIKHLQPAELSPAQKIALKILPQEGSAESKERLAKDYGKDYPILNMFKEKADGPTFAEVPAHTKADQTNPPKVEEPKSPKKPEEKQKTKDASGPD